jgi:CNT family concentrative nucleoside transporter
VAYLQLAGTLSSGVPALHPRSAVIATYALLGFANFSSIAIQIGGIGGLAPERRGDLAKLGLKAMIGGNLAAFMSASLAGMLL